MNSKLKILLITIFLFILINKINYSITNENLEETYIQVKVRKIKDDFFKVKYDYATDEIYIGCNNLFYLLEIFTLEIDIKNKGIKGELDGKKINVKFNSDDAFVEDEELYVRYKVLGKKLNFKLTKYNPAILSLEMEPNFTLSYEHRAKGKLERIRLEDKENKKIDNHDLVMEGRIFRPGLLKVNYSFDDFKEKNNYYLSYEYGTELLYGEYYMNGILKPKSEISTAKLSYSNFYKENNLSIGTFNMVTPSFLNIDTDVIGINLNGDTTYTRRENGITIIKGEAIGAESVEIYRNNVLLDYTSIINNNFKFEINDGILNSTYLLKIYYENGKIEEKWVYSLGDENILENGKKKVVAQSGKSTSNGDFQNIYGLYYGVNDYLTLGAEIQNLKDLDNKKYNFLKTSTIFNTGLQNFPTLINYKNYLDLDDVDFIHNISILQKFYDVNLKLQHDIYSEKISKIIKLKNESSFSVSKGFKTNILELGMNKKKREDIFKEKLDEKSLYLLWYTSLLNPVSFSLKVDKILTKGNEGTIYNPTLSYSRDFSIILDGRIEKYKDNLETEQDYKLKLTKRQIELIKNKLYGDISLQAEYNYNRREITYGIAFNIELDDFIKVYSKNTLDIDKNKNIEKSSGISLTKLINLSNPLQTLDNNSSVNNYTIEGRVFLDRNGNGVYDKGDEVVEGVEVLADNKGGVSNKEGYYIINDSSNKDDIVLKVNQKTIDVMLKSTKGDLKIKVKNSRTINVDIPLEVISMITGNIWNTDDFSEKKFTQNIANTSIELIKDNEIYKEFDPEFDGMYFLDDVTPGKYKLRFLYLGIENVEFEPKEIDIEVKLENPDEGIYIEGLDTRMLIRKTENNIESIKSNELLDEFDDLIGIE